MSGRPWLSEEQVNRAYRLFYGEGLNLAEIMRELNCGLYDLSPWLTAPALRIAAAAIEDERAAQRAPTLSSVNPPAKEA
ncbi:hypothetical protein [Methylorubrum sp. DB1722]|uniref:hypothetical protein n=1 Tax=Methylorubrum sp. DB1722 TaxID=2478916 RepID=UPI0018E35714|nr:hypothetical protein [Methylorubrum sp. DB1722]MBI1690485.1 hypothetical protein [Methylorubrum sp. DB1722]